jgi:primosomal protein N'
MLGNNEPPIYDLVDRWLDLKKAEDDAKIERIKIEEEMINFLETKTEGSATTTLEDNTKITVKCGFSRKLDLKAWEKVKQKIVPEVRPIKTKIELDVPELKKLKEKQPLVYNTISEAITVTPSKPNFTITKEETNGF